MFRVVMRHPLNRYGLTVIFGESITVGPGASASGFGSVVALWLHLAERGRDARYGKLYQYLHTLLYLLLNIQTKGGNPVCHSNLATRGINWPPRFWEFLHPISQAKRKQALLDYEFLASREGPERRRVLLLIPEYKRCTQTL